MRGANNSAPPWGKGAANTYYRRLLDAAELVSVAERLMPERRTGVTGDEITYDCPRHESDSKRSLTLSIQKQVWHCWGCNEGGDALHLVEFVRHGTTTKKSRGRMPDTHCAARDELAEIVGMPTLASEGLTEDEVRELEELRRDRTQVFSCLTKIAQLYHEDLLANGEALAWIEEKYGFGREVVEKYRIGFANDAGIARRLVAEGHDAELLPKTGAFYPSKAGGLPRPFFKGRVVFPFFDGDEVAYFIGRKTPWTPERKSEAGKYKKLPVHDADKRPHVSVLIDNSLLWGENCLRARNKCVLITEGITDAIAAAAAGFAVISPATVRIKAQDLGRVAHKLAAVDRVVLILDNELSAVGQSAAIETVDTLSPYGIKAFVGELPLAQTQQAAREAFDELLGEELAQRFKVATAKERGQLLRDAFADRAEDLARAKELMAEAKIDVCEWFRIGGTKAQFQELLDAAKSSLELRIEVLEPGTELDDIREVLSQVAALSPLERERCLLRIKDLTGISLAALRKEIAPETKIHDKARAASVVQDQDGEDVPLYEATTNGLVWNKRTQEGTIPVALTNFTARIVASVIEDDGVEQNSLVELDVWLRGAARNITIPGRTFAGMSWAMEYIGSKAIVYAGMSTRDHARAAIQVLSPDARVRSIYTHTGWREIEGVGWVYLHAAGAIGPEGPVKDGIEVRVQGPIANYILPAPPQGAALVMALAAVLRFLLVAPARIAYTAFAIIWRAVLDASDFAGHFYGESGTFKTEIAALCQSFWGAGLHARNLPGSWSSTGNALEGSAFVAKDALFIVDDFNPTGSSQDIQRAHREADRLLRAQGNQLGRGRMRADGSLRPPKPPRGTILSTGEEIPAGQSLRARLCVVEFGRGDVNLDQLSGCQRDAREGVYASVMAAFIQWLAPRRDDVAKRRAARAIELRTKAASEAQHRRTPDMVASIMSGFEVWLEFTIASGALTNDEAVVHARNCWVALLESAETQSDLVRDAEATSLFFRLLSSAVASGAAHVANLAGKRPHPPHALGWREQEGFIGPDGVVFREQGIRVGWIDGEDLYLDLNAAHAAAQKMATESERLCIGTRTLTRRMAEKGLLKSRDGARGKHVVRITVEGRRKDVLHVASYHLLDQALRAHQAPDPHSEGPGGGPGPEAWARNGAGETSSGPDFGPTSPSSGRRGAASEAAGPNGPEGPESAQVEGADDGWSEEDKEMARAEREAIQSEGAGLEGDAHA